MIHPVVGTTIIDASAAVALAGYRGAAGEWVAGALGTSTLCAPDLMPFEAANALRRRLLSGTFDESAARAALARLRMLPVMVFPFALVADRAWELRANLTIYDASYVALAELLEAPLVTLDARIGRAPGLRCEVRAFEG